MGSGVEEEPSLNDLGVYGSGVKVLKARYDQREIYERKCSY